MSRHRQLMAPGTFVILLLLVTTLIVQTAFQTRHLRTQSANLSLQHTQQQAAVEQAQQVRRQLESIAGATARLADQGNPNAILIRDQLQSQGVTIRASGP